MNKRRGRRKPYTVRGIARVPCARCGRPSVHQWQVCANDRLFQGVCRECDLELNRLVLDYFRVPGRQALMQRYERKPPP